MKLPEDVRGAVLKIYRRQWCEWIADNDQRWPLIISLEIPTEQAALNQAEAVCAWVASWQQWQQGVGQLIWCKRHWKILGPQTLPEKLMLSTPDEVALLLGESARWERARHRWDLLTMPWPTLKKMVKHHFHKLVDYADEDFICLKNLLQWLIDHPHSNLYPRQLPVPGLDSKWLEKRKPLVTDLVADIFNDNRQDHNFYQCCGLKSPPTLLRARILDERLRKIIGNFGDLSAPIEQWTQLKLPLTQVIIVENLQTGLAFSEMPGTIVIMMLGYAIDLLARLPWLAELPCYYWGDMDTHGFAILNRLRSYFPQVQSILMDEQTLLRHQPQWGSENTQHQSETLTHLMLQEQGVYQGLKQQRWQQNLRLEQERIEWDYAMDVLFTSVGI